MFSRDVNRCLRWRQCLAPLPHTRGNGNASIEVQLGPSRNGASAREAMSPVSHGVLTKFLAQPRQVEDQELDQLDVRFALGA